MAGESVFSGESKNVEYKVVVPDKSEKYLKTIVAFANTQGGQLVIGIDDKTRQVIGVDNEELFGIMDSMANAISDSCEPQLIPDIEPRTVDGKNIIVVTVEAGKNRPYYLKSKGKENGTYIRVAGTSRQALPDKIKELEMEGARISWDELTCVGYPVTVEATEKLCSDIELFRKKAGMSERDVRTEQLVNWRILKQGEGQLLATNAYTLLTSDYFPFSKTQCAVFKGTDRTVFLDKREFSGPIYTQIEEAVSFVLRNIRLGATIDGLVRREQYELPPEAIREMIINAQCHRNFLEESCIQVAVYDNRLEVTSPGGLYNGLTYEEVLNGHSKIRNKAIANIFSQMGLVEAWGSGIERIFRGAEKYGLPMPEIQEFDNMFRIELFRHQAQNMTESSNTDQADQGTDQADQGTDQADWIVKQESTVAAEKLDLLSKEEKTIINLVRKQPAITQQEMASTLEWSLSRVKYYITKLKEKEVLYRRGTSQNGIWLVKEKD